MFNVSCSHARGNTECSCDGRQNTNRGLNHELPYFLVLHNDLVFDFTLIDYLSSHRNHGNHRNENRQRFFIR